MFSTQRAIQLLKAKWRVNKPKILFRIRYLSKYVMFSEERIRDNDKMIEKVTLSQRQIKTGENGWKKERECVRERKIDRWGELKIDRMKEREMKW